MTGGYEESARVWDGVFSALPVSVPDSPSTGIPPLDTGLDWLCRGGASLLDFGCGSGSLLFYCAMRGAAECTGIDISPEAVRLARKRAKLMTCGSFEFLCGGLETLASLPDASRGGAVLSNILDNLLPDDAGTLLSEIRRILRPGGRLLIKLSPYLSPDDAAREGLVSAGEDMLEGGGLPLLNLTDGAWEALIGRHFSLSERCGDSQRIYLALRK